MASYSVTKAKHATLVASTVDAVTITSDTAAVIRVDNRSGSAEIYFTVATPSAPAIDPTVTGDNTYVVAAAITYRTVTVVAGQAVTVKLISTGTPTYSVTGTGS